MVLKRKQDGEFVPWTSSSSEATGSGQQAPIDGPSPPKKTRTQPSRSKASTTTKKVVSASSVAAPKKTRAPRGKKVVKAVASDPAPATPVAGPSSIPHAGPSQPSAPPPAKRGRKKKTDVDDEPSGSQPEKRKAQFKPHCPQNILDRVERVMTQRIFMIDRTRNDGELREEFSILGSTGNVYTVTIDHIPRCNCPDQVRGNHCKHILFVFLKVLQVPRGSGLWYQKALLTTELEQIFRDAPLAPNSVAHNHIREAHARATGKAAAPEVISSADNKRIPGPDDDCPICYDGMHGVAETTLVFCEECGNALHKECFGEWRKTATKNGKDLTCVWCRANWVVHAPGGVAGGTATRVAGGYLNLASVAGVTSVRDTSTYYQGPRRGERYGYPGYYD